MALPFQYSFVGSEAPLATHWSTYASYGLKENGSDALPNTAGVSCFSYIDDETFANNQYVEIGITSLTNYPGVVLRINGTDCIIVYVRSQGDRIYCVRWNNGTTVSLIGAPGYITTTVSAGQRLRAEVSGTTVQIFAGDAGSLTQRGSDVDASTAPASGPAGIYVFGIDTTTGTISDVDTGDLGAGATPINATPSDAVSLLDSVGGRHNFRASFGDNLEN